jgi:hypothetical protein
MSFNFVYLHIIFVLCFMFNNIKNVKNMLCLLLLFVYCVNVYKNIYYVCFVSFKSKWMGKFSLNLTLCLFYFRASTMELPILWYLNGFHIYTSQIYSFLIIESIKYLIPPTQYLLKNFKWIPLIIHHTNNST